MGKLFNTDGAFYKAGSMVADAVVLSFFWLLFSLPVVTIGASTTALFYVSTRRISNREGYLFRDFFKSFKENFYQANIVWVLFCMLMGILYLNIVITKHYTGIAPLLSPLYIFFMFELCISTLYVFPVIARFHLSYKELLKTAFFMANKHFITTCTCLLLIAALSVIIFIVPPLFFLGVGAYALLASFLIMRVFRKYRPDIDVDLPTE